MAQLSELEQKKVKKPRRNRKKDQFPSKLTLNMAMREKSPLSPVKVIPSMLLLFLALALFGKYAVANRLYGVQQAQQELTQLNAQVAELESGLSAFKEIQEQYDRYSNAWIPQEDQALVYRSSLLSIMDRFLMPYTQIHSVSMAGNMLSLELDSASLDSVSTLVRQLSALPQVISVDVSTVNRNEPEEEKETPDVTSVSMLITFQDFHLEGGAE